MTNMTSESILAVARLIKNAHRLTVLTGAGVSAESGIPTFRASDGLWEGHSIEDVATPSGWKRDPQWVWDFYHARRAKAATVSPNPGHFALATLQQRFGERFTLTTQNVDGLHTVAGNTDVLELHGSLRRTRCTACGDIRDRGLEALPPMPRCECGQIVRPDIVWFQEMLPADVWRKAERAAKDCDLFFVVGTSAVVYPAAGLIEIAKSSSRHATIVEFNLQQTEASPRADYSLFGPSGETLPSVVEYLL
jgi:NAD-dependent deacetylase